MKNLFLVALLTCSTLVSSCSTLSASHRKPAHEFAPIVFSVLGSNQELIARVVTQDATCPMIDVDGTKTAMNTRISPDEDVDFPVRVCEAVVSPQAQHASVLGQTIPLTKKSLSKIIVMGDSGCRLKGDLIQNCHNPEAWPFAQIAESAKQEQPDLVIHTGDYFYREFCDASRPECQNTPLGDRWDTWYADFFKPTENLLKSAPWIFVRGNHESCARGGKGFFKILNPGLNSTQCEKELAPYPVQFQNQQFIVMDSSPGEPTQKSLSQISALSPKKAILFTHRPIFSVQSKLPIGKIQGVRANFNGHWHTFHVTEFKDHRPTQIVVGNSGDLLDQKSNSLPLNTNTDGSTVTLSDEVRKFGYSTLEWNQGKLKLKNHDAAGAVNYSLDLK